MTIPTRKPTLGRYKVEALGTVEPTSYYSTKYDACAEADRIREAYHADRVGIQVTITDRRLGGTLVIARWIGVGPGLGWASPAYLAINNMTAPPLRIAGSIAT